MCRLVLQILHRLLHFDEQKEKYINMMTKKQNGDFKKGLGYVLQG